MWYPGRCGPVVIGTRAGAVTPLTRSKPNNEKQARLSGTSEQTCRLGITNLRVG